MSGEMKIGENKLQAVMAKLTDVDSLKQAFDGCRGVFHTAAFTDPAGLSGYTVSFLSFFITSLFIFHKLSPNPSSSSFNNTPSFLKDHTTMFTFC